MGGFATRGDVRLRYQVVGDPAGPPLLLVNGFGGQLVSWPEGMVDAFLAAGYRVVRFDNRDVGESTKSPAPAPDLGAVAGGSATPPYLLADMAADAVAVLDAVGIEQAHVWGASMGGMIVQSMAIGFAERCASMTSVMSTTGDRAVGRGTPEALQALQQPMPTGREAYLDESVRRARVTNGPLFDEAYTRERAAAEYDRCFHPLGLAFQMAAIVGSPDRTPDLRGVGVPTTVIHGDADPLVGPSGGEATAAAVPGARLVMLADMGHNYPAQYWPTFVAELDALVARA